MWKVRKPLQLPFLDQRSLAEQRRLCEREVQLNSRLAPDVYLGVVDVDDPRLGGRRPATLMRRMPDSRRLAALITGGVDVRHEIRDIARTLAAFHLRAPRGPHIALAGTPEAVAKRWHDCLAVLDRFSGGVLDRAEVGAVRRLADEFIAGRAPLFRRRMAIGRIVDGHGDLLADDIFCLISGPRILDCLEFSDRLRYCDVLSDVCSLVMDCERLGDPQLGALLLREYTSFTADTFPCSLADHYIAHRAVIRCEVACLRHDDGDVEAAEQAARLLSIAVLHVRASRPLMLLLGGLPGTGKSTVAAALADVHFWTLIRSDSVRREIVSPESSTASSAWQSPPFSSTATRATYQRVLEHAATLLGLGESVILDASWSSAAHRRAAEKIATATHSAFLALRCEAPAAVAERRIVRRLATGTDISTAGVDVARRMAAIFEPWAGAVTLDTALPVAETMDAAHEAIRAVLLQEPGPPPRSPSLA